MDLRLINKQKSLSRSLRDSDSDPISLIKLVSEGIMIRAIRANISAILAVLEPLKGVPRKTTPAVDLSTSLKLWLLAESKAYSIIRPVLAIPVNFLFSSNTFWRTLPPIECATKIIGRPLHSCFFFWMFSIVRPRRLSLSTHASLVFQAPQELFANKR